MATTQGSFTRIYDGLRHGPLPLQRYKTTVTIPAGATEISIVPSNEASGTVVAVWIDPSTLTAGATIKGYAQNDGLATLGPEYFIDYTVPNPAVETRDALNERIRVHGRIQIDVASATAGDSFVLYVWVDPSADTSTATTDLPAAIAAALDDLVIDADNIKLAANTDATYIGDIKFGEGLPAGTNIIGKVGIDQTTPGTTNAVQASNPVSTVTATIADDASLSGAVDLGSGMMLCGVAADDWTAADMTFQVADAIDGTFYDLYDQNATEKNVKFAADRHVALDDGTFWTGVRFLKVRSGTSASPVVQDRAGGTPVTLFVKPV